MKAYIVTKGEYSDYRIKAVFLKKKNAENYIYNCHEDLNSYDDPHILEEWDIGKADKKRRPFWDGAMNRDGSLRLIQKCNNNKKEYIKFQYHPLAEYTYISFLIDAKSKEHAIKIINEKRAGIVASGMWDNPEKFPGNIIIPGYVGGSIEIK